MMCDGEDNLHIMNLIVFVYGDGEILDLDRKRRIIQDLLDKVFIYI